jgi:aminopeptidase N
MAPYLAFFAAGDFAVAHGRHRGLPWYVAVSRQLRDGQRRTSMRQMRRSPRIVRWLETQLGDYPFSTTGGVVTGLSVGFALENQTRPTYPAVGGRATSLLVHELAHQWFGDSVSVRRWADIWLNEGFATFMELRYRQTHGGQSVRSWLCHEYTRTTPAHPFWNLRIGDPGPRRIFDGAVYERGAMTLAALETRIGSADLWEILRRWVSENADGNASTADFQALAEEVSGADLDGFVDAWLFSDVRPADVEDNGLAC